MFIELINSLLAIPAKFAHTYSSLHLELKECY